MSGLAGVAVVVVALAVMAGAAAGQPRTEAASAARRTPSADTRLDELTSQRQMLEEELRAIDAARPRPPDAGAGALERTLYERAAREWQRAVDRLRGEIADVEREIENVRATTPGARGPTIPP
jgi:hypothetical protein